MRVLAERRRRDDADAVARGGEKRREGEEGLRVSAKENEREGANSRGADARLKCEEEGGRALPLPPNLLHAVEQKRKRE